MPNDERGFLLLPLAEQLRDGRISDWKDGPLSVLVVLIAHENARTREARPAISRIAVLAGIRKANVRPCLESLAAAGWCRPAKGSAWEMLTARYDGDSTRWIRISRPLIFDGVWSVMPPSAKRLYLVLLSLAWMGHHANYECISCYDLEDYNYDSEDFVFVPAQHAEPVELARLAGLEPRTFRQARQWLLNAGLIQPTSQDQAPGLLLPHDPRLSAPSVMERLARVRAEVNRPTGAALRAHRAVGKAARKGIKNSKIIQSSASERNGRNQQTERTEPINGTEGTASRNQGNVNNALTMLEQGFDNRDEAGRRGRPCPAPPRRHP